MEAMGAGIGNIAEHIFPSQYVFTFLGILHNILDRS